MMSMFGMARLGSSEPSSQAYGSGLGPAEVQLHGEESPGDQGLVKGRSVRRDELRCGTKQAQHDSKRKRRRFGLPVLVLASACSGSGAPSGGGPLPPAQQTAVIDDGFEKSGISVSLTGLRNVNWVTENTFHDNSLGDTIYYVKSGVQFSLAHNERNVITLDSSSVPHVIGENGADGIPATGDEGDIYYKVDRDLQASQYSTRNGPLPSYCVPYAAPFRFGTLTYDGSIAVLGATGDNGGAWGTAPKSTADKFAFGQLDRAGNEWHTLTYWDDDEPLLAAAGVSSHRQGASDGYSVFVCVNPTTPIVQLEAVGDEQYYTTPVKTYHIPKIWQQTSYLTSGVELSFLNITNSEPVQYRVDGGSWRTFTGVPLMASNLFASSGVAVNLELRNGASGPILTRRVVMDPGYPDVAEQHGKLLWGTETERLAMVNRVHNVQPFKKSYETFRNNFYQGVGAVSDGDLSNTRGSWVSGSNMAQHALSNALVVSVEGPANASVEAILSKGRLLRMARLQPVGGELTPTDTSPAKDFLGEIGQPMQGYGDAAVAYDLLAAHFRKSQHASGMSPVEEYMIRDGLAKIAKSLLQFRGNFGALSGGGDTHWALGYEHAIGMIALAMPEYDRGCYGVSGGNRISHNDVPDSDGMFWNPFPGQGVTWYEAATDAAVATPGHPNISYPFRADFLLTDDGYWTGPNGRYADGDRYFNGVLGNKIVDVSYGGLANAEARIEQVEMDAYETPFVERVHAFDHMRRIVGDQDRPLSVTNYIRRRLVDGYVSLTWDSGAKCWEQEPARIERSLLAFNNEYEFASLTRPMAAVGSFLNKLNIYYGFTGGSLNAEEQAAISQDRKLLYRSYALALCVDPAELFSHQAEPNHPPIVKPLLRYVLEPGDALKKKVIVADSDGDSLTVSVAGLPAGASYNAGTHTIHWTPGFSAVGAYILSISVTDGVKTTVRPFPVVVKASSGTSSLPTAPLNLTAVHDSGNNAVRLNWDAPGGAGVFHYLIYRDGELWACVPGGGATTYLDREMYFEGQNTTYYISLMDAAGTESMPALASPSVLHIPVQ